MKRLLIATITIVSIMCSSTITSFADNKYSQLDIISILRVERLDYENLAKLQLSDSEYKQFIKGMTVYKTKLDKMKSDIKNDNGVYYDLKDYQSISYGMYILTCKYNLDKGDN